jgi:hypothetical protein
MPWYSCPFENNRNYRVKYSVAELGHTFKKGEIVRFQGDSYDPKQGVIRFWFQAQDSNEMQAWHVWESEIESLSRWQDLFTQEPD